MSRKALNYRVFDKKFAIPADLVKQQVAYSLIDTENNVNHSFRVDYLIRSLLSKLPVSGVPAEVRRSNALRKLRLSESKLRYFNENGFESSVSSVLMRASHLISNVLGGFSYDVFRAGRYSGGSSLTHKFGESTAWHKYGTAKYNTCTPSAYRYAAALIGNTPLWCSQAGLSNIMLVKGNTVGTVPKKTDEDRTIAKEPDLNMYLQLAIGHHIRTRLKYIAGIDLNDQTINQRLALEASLTWLSAAPLATLDLANASNSISWRLVFELLPREWFDVLDDIRSKRGIIEDKDGYVEWEMFSSMGNGFTFELESLIFWALGKAIAESIGRGDTLLSVYGDDIIADVKVAEAIVDIFPKFGFEINVDKSFTHGPFYESCGKHYYNGLDVTPFYVRKPIDSVFRVIWLLNKIRQWSYDPAIGVCSPQLYETWRYIYVNYYPHKGGICDIESDKSVYQYTSSRRTAEVCVEKTKTSFKYDVRAYLAKWQTVTEDGSAERLPHLRCRDIQDFSITHQKGVYTINKSCEVVRDYVRTNPGKAFSYGFPQEMT